MLAFFLGVSPLPLCYSAVRLSVTISRKKSGGFSLPSLTRKPTVECQKEKVRKDNAINILTFKILFLLLSKENQLGYFIYKPTKIYNYVSTKSI